MNYLLQSPQNNAIMQWIILIGAVIAIIWFVKYIKKSNKDSIASKISSSLSPTEVEIGFKISESGKSLKSVLQLHLIAIPFSLIGSFFIFLERDSNTAFLQSIIALGIIALLITSIVLLFNCANKLIEAGEMMSQYENKNKSDE